MAKTLSEKIIEKHLQKGEMKPGEEITIGIDQVLLQDATGTMAWLEFEAMGVDKVKPERVTQYIDHNMIQADEKNMDDHLFLMTMCSKYGAHCSLPGNGISHHVHKERFTKPGQTMLGADSHTPSSGGTGMLAIGVGGLDAAVAMARGTFTLTMPSVVGVHLTGALQPWCSAMDVILEILRRIDVKGGVGKILEFYGEGVKNLSASDRSTICNMGAETGATASIFPSDERTREFFVAEGRKDDFVEMSADDGAEYAEVMEIDLSAIEPLVACPYSPGNVKTVRELKGMPVQQAIIGSSTNSSYEQFATCAEMVAQERPQAQYLAIPGSRQLLETLTKDGYLMKLLKAGTRITEPSCNACIGMGNAPGTDVNTVRSFPRNWEGRSGTEHDQVYLASPETVTACAIKGEFTDPRDLDIDWPAIKEPTSFEIDDKMVLEPKFDVEVRRGPNIKKIEFRDKVENTLEGKVVIKVEDEISTDHILPAGAEVLPYRSNIPAISEFLFYRVDPEFKDRVKEYGGGFIVGGDTYGQGSSREHAAIAPMHVGIVAVIAKSFARIHRKNLINYGIVPVEFANPSDYDHIDQDDELVIDGVMEKLKSGEEMIEIQNKTKGSSLQGKLMFTEGERNILMCGSLLSCLKHDKI